MTRDRQASDRAASVAPALELTDRQRSILRVVVEDYVLTAVPVGSKALVTRYGLGVARLLSVSKSAHAPEGKVQADAISFMGDITGASRLAVIYVDHDMANAALSSSDDPLSEQELEAAREHWLFDFPPGYSCAEGRDAGPGETFDTLVPVDCAQLEISAGTDVPFPNWT